MMSPTRSALNCTICSDSSRCARRLSQPKMPKITAVLETRAMASFTVRPARSFALPFAEGDELPSISGFREDGQLLHREPEYSESEGDNGERDSYLCPARDIVRSRGSFHPGDAHVQAVGDKAENGQHRTAIQRRGILVDPALE